MSNANLKILVDVALPVYLSEAVQRLERAQTDEVIDLDDVFLELTTQLMGNMAYGVREMLRTFYHIKELTIPDGDAYFRSILKSL